MDDTPRIGFKNFADPLELVDQTDISYERRLALLQEWQEELARKDAPLEHREAVTGAIQALEMGAAVQNDEPDAGPEGRVPGVQTGD